MTIDYDDLKRWGNADTDEIGRRSGWGEREDGYWTPWHIAADAIAALREQVAVEAKLRVQLSEDSQMHLDRALAAEADNAALRKDAEYLTWRLKAIIPLFEEARDALPAITMVSAKLHAVDLSLGDRMDHAGTQTRADFDAAMLAGKEKA